MTPYFDLKQHLKEWHNLALPLFVVVAAILLVLFLMARTNDGAAERKERMIPADRLGLIKIGPDAVFDPAFAVASPIEMVKAPTADHFDFPTGSRLGALAPTGRPLLTNPHPGAEPDPAEEQNATPATPVYAVADGLVLYAGSPSGTPGEVIILQHERGDGRLVQTFYGSLDAMNVPVGSLVRRGEKIGTTGAANTLHPGSFSFAIRHQPTIEVGRGALDDRPGHQGGEALLTRWRNRPDDALVSAPEGTAPEPRPFQLDSGEDAPVAP